MQCFIPIIGPITKAFGKWIVVDFQLRHLRIMFEERHRFSGAKDHLRRCFDRQSQQ